MQQSTALPGVSRLICVATPDHPRFSEADLIELSDGRLFLAVGRKNGASDFAPGTIIGMFSSDGGRSWDDQPRVIQEQFDDVIDLMSVSLCRSKRGLHLFFLGRGKQAKQDTRVYQMRSTDEAKSWSQPQRVSTRPGYHIVNNARVITTTSGRMIVPAAYVEDMANKSDQQRIYCMFSDDQGETWKASNDLVLEGQPLMEPGVAQCADGSLHMTIRTKLKKLWQARSIDDGATWIDLKESPLPSPAAPSTVTRAPTSDELWMFWCDRPEADWKGRSHQVFAISKDHGKTWSPPRVIEHDEKGSFGYISVDVVQDHLLLTYYDWRDRGQKSFENTSLRQRMIPIAWVKGEAPPPVFQSDPEPVVRSDQPYEGGFCSVNSGVLADGAIWRMWYTTNTPGGGEEMLRVAHAQSADQGKTWTKTGVVFPGKDEGDDARYYHASLHRDDNDLIAYVWRSVRRGDSGLYRFVSKDDGKSFARDPEMPVIAAWWTGEEFRKKVGEGRVSNDAFDVIRDPRRGWVYYAASIEKATDPRMNVKHDNLKGNIRVLGRAQSADGVEFSPLEVVLRPEFAERNEWTQQFYGLQPFRYGQWWLGLLHTYYVESQIIQPEWVWSHDGYSWARTRTPAISLGDEGAWDSRMIVFGDIIQTPDELIWLYSGNDWRHNEYARKNKGRSCIGRATIFRKDLEAWLATLPQP